MKLTDAITGALLLAIGGYTAARYYQSRPAPRPPLSESELGEQTSRCLQEGHDWCMRPTDCAVEIADRTGRHRLPQSPAALAAMTSREMRILNGVVRQSRDAGQRQAAISRLLIEADIGTRMNRSQRADILSDLMTLTLADDDPHVRKFTARFLPHAVSGLGRAEDPQSRSRALALSRRFTAAADASQDQYLRDQARACAQLLAAPR